MNRTVFFLAPLLVVMLLSTTAVRADVSEVVEDPHSLTEGLERLGDFAGDQGVKTHGTVTTLIITIINGLLAVSALLALGALVWGGMMYIMSLGDEGRAGTAKKIVMYAVIGVVVVLLSFVIIQSIQRLLL